MLPFKVYFGGLLMWTNEQIKGKILHKLTRKGKFEHSHTALDNLAKARVARQANIARRKIELIL